MGPEKNYKHRDIIFLAGNQVHNKHFQCIPQKDAMLKKCIVHTVMNIY